MSMLGATTSELIELAAQLGATTTDIGGVGVDTQQVARTVVDEMHGSFASAIGGITGAMGTLRSSVDAASGRLEATTWTGANRDTFAGAYGDFNAAMVNLESAVNDAYAQFDGQMKQIAELIEDFQSQVSAGLDQAQTSTTSMATAVDAQRDNLETVMNTGLAVG